MKLPSYFRLAKECSVLSDHHAHKLGSVILTSDRKVLSKGYNLRYKTHPIMKQYMSLKTIHAELSAILNVKNKSLLNGATMVVYRQSKDGKVANARPCSTCEQILKSFGFKTIIYTINNGFAKETL